MEGNEEIKVEEPKKKRGISLFTLFACLMTAFIVVLAMQIGDRIGKRIADEDINPQPKVTASNNNSDSNINSDSNSNSNETQNTETKTYTVKDLVGIYVFDEKDATTHLILRENGLYLRSVTPKGPACAGSTVGSYYVEGDKIILNGIFSFGCDGQAELSVGQTTGTLTEGKITFDKTVYTFNKKDVSEYGKTDKDFIKNYIFETAGQKYAVETAANNTEDAQ